MIVLIAGGCHEFVKPGVVSAAAPTVVGDACAVLYDILDGRHGIGDGAAIFAEELSRHDCGAGGDADDASIVVADGGDGSGGVCAVIHGYRISLIVEKVPTVNVINVPVAVVVLAVEWIFAFIGPNGFQQILVFDIDAIVDYRNDDTIGVGLHGPGFIDSDVNARSTGEVGIGAVWI